MKLTIPCKNMQYININENYLLVFYENKIYDLLKVLKTKIGCFTLRFTEEEQLH